MRQKNLGATFQFSSAALQQLGRVSLGIGSSVPSFYVIRYVWFGLKRIGGAPKSQLLALKKRKHSPSKKTASKN
jgi:hypothetical protein